MGADRVLLPGPLQFVRAVMGRWPKAVLQFEVRNLLQVDVSESKRSVFWRS